MSFETLIIFCDSFKDWVKNALGLCEQDARRAVLHDHDQDFTIIINKA